MSGKKIARKVLFNVLIAALAIFWLIPIVWLVCTSFSAYSGMNTSTFFPAQWSAEHYLKLLQSDTVNQFTTWFWNTFKIACVTCLVSTFFVLMVAYAMSVMRFKMRKPLMNFAVILNLFPGMLAMIAVYFTLKTFNLTNSHIGLIMVYSASSGLGYLIAKGFFDTVPRSLCEAARLDGAGEWYAFARIGLPLGYPGIVTALTLSFVDGWNGLEQPITYLKDKTLWPVALYLPDIARDKASVAFAAALIVCMLPALLYLDCQEELEIGVAASGVKQ